MRLTVRTTKDGWEQKLEVGGKTYALTAHVEADGTVVSDEGLSMSEMMKRRGVDAKTVKAVAKNVDAFIEPGLGLRIYMMERKGRGKSHK